LRNHILERNGFHGDPPIANQREGRANSLKR
jgi:hypothetical protein